LSNSCPPRPGCAGLREADAPTPDQIRLRGDADFVELWLFPRLARFENDNPDLRISISVTVGLNAPPAKDWDCAVFWGRGDWSGVRFEALLTNTVFPVAAPDYFANVPRPPRLSDIPERHLIHDQTRFWWRAFRESSGAARWMPMPGASITGHPFVWLRRPGGMGSRSGMR